MYKIVKLTEKELIEQYKNYKLCYVDDIEKTAFDYESARKDKEKFGYCSYGSREYEIPNPEYKKGEFEYYAYFTPRSMNAQTGDDWNDCPYEHNAGIPYDHIITKVVDCETCPGLKIAKEIKYIEIIKVPFSTRSFNTSFPKDYSYGGNSSFCVDSINRGAVAWIYDFVDKKHSVAIYGGCTLKKFSKLIDKIIENNKKSYYISEDDE